MHTSIWKGVSRTLALRLVGVFAVVAAALALAAPALATKPAQAATEDPVVADASTTWSYVDSGTRPAEGWQTSEAVTGSDWKTGTGAFGAKKGKLESLGTLANGKDATPKTLLTQYKEDGKTDIPVYFFRTTFDVKDVNAVKAITGSVDYDDAAIVAINGQVVAEFDNHIKDGTDPIYGTDQYGGSNKNAPLTGEVKFSDVSKLNLKPTGNVLSVELHNGRSSSSDIYLDVTNLTLSSTEIASEPETPTEPIKNVFVNIGKDEAHRNFNWLGTATNDSSVQYAKVDTSFKDGDPLPQEGVTTKQATRSEEPAESYQGDPVIANFKVSDADGFEANSTYAYRVGNDTDGWSSTYTFKTGNQGSGADFTFLVAGDPQIGSSGNDKLDGEKWATSVNQAFAKNPDASFLFSMGDQVENGSNGDPFAEYDYFGAPQALRNLTLATELGNHDYKYDYYSGQYHLPNMSTYGVTTGGAESGDYWFMYNGVLFMSLNSNDKTLPDHKAFMEGVLATDEAKSATWKVVSFHHAPFSVASHYSDGSIKTLRAQLTPILSDLGVDVVLTGHDHYYTRTYMLDANGNPSADAQGKYEYDNGEDKAPTAVNDPAEGDVLYLTADSASGSKYYKLNSSLNGQYPAYSAYSWQQNNPTFVVAKVSGDSFTLEMYQSEDNNTQAAEWTKIDSFTINRAKAPEPVAPSLSVPADGSVAFGSEFDPMRGVKATAGDGTTDLTDKVEVSVSGPKGATAVDTKVAGDYAITYTVKDPATGLTATASRTLTVEAEPATTEPATTEPATTEPATTEPATGAPTTGSPTTGAPTSGAPTDGAPTDGAPTGDADGSTPADRGGKPNRQLPQTGDQNLVAPVLAIAAIAAAAIIAGVVVRKRHDN